MAVDGGDVKFTFSGDSSQLRDELDALSDALQGVNESGQGAANALDEELGAAASSTSTALGAQTEATGKATKQTAKYGEGLNKAGDALTNAAGAVGSVASVIGHFNPEVAESVRVLGDMTNSAGQLMKAMAQGPIVFAAAATAAGLYALAVKDATDRQKRHDEALEEEQKEYDRVTAAIARQKELKDRLVRQYDEAAGKVETAIDFLNRERQAIHENMLADIALHKRRADQGKLTQDAAIRYIENATKRAQADYELADATFELLLIEERHANSMKQIADNGVKLAKVNQEITQSHIDYALGVRGLLDLDGDVIVSQGKTLDQRALGVELMGEYSKVLNAATLSEIANRQSIADTLPVLQEQQNAMMEQRRIQEGLNQSITIAEKTFEEQAASAFLLTQQYEEQYGGAFQIVLGNGELVQSLADVEDAIDGNVSGYETLISVQDTENNTLMTLNDFLLQAHKQEQKAARERERKARQDEKQRQARYKARKARREAEIAQIKGMVESEIAQMQSRSDQIAIAQMSDLDAIDARYHAEVQALEEAALAHIERAEAGKLSEDLLNEFLSQSIDTREALDKEYAENKLAAEQALAENIGRIRDKQREDQKARDDQELEDLAALHNAYATGWADLSGTIADAYAMKADQMAESDRQAALNAFEASKAAAIIQAQIHAALAITDIFSEHAGNPIAIGFLSAVAAAATGVQIAAIASQPPPFHSGGIIGDPQERQITALEGEAVLNRQATAALGRSGVDALNSGQGMTPQVIALPVYKHFDKFVRDESRRGGKLTRLLNPAKGYGVGQRGY